MLSQLYIKNIAVISEASIDFGPRFNVFTGETGAGKTILVSAINGVLGARMSRDIIRSGEDSAYVSALFTQLPQDVCAKIEERGFEMQDDTLLIAREVGSRNLCKVNGRPATVQLLREIASMLIDVHGQKDNHRLLSPENHIAYIDAFGGLEDCRREYQVLYEKILEVRNQLERVNRHDREKEHQVDLLTYQIGEIESAALHPGEEEELLLKRDQIANAERIIRLLSQSKQLLDGEEEVSGILQMFEELTNNLSQLTHFLPQMEPLAMRMEEIGYDLSDCAGDLGNYLDQMDYQPQELEQVEERLDLIYRLKRKYGNSIEEILEYLEKSREQLQQLNLSEEKAQELQEEYLHLKPQVQQAADMLTSRRHKAAKEFLSRVKKELEFLNMPSVRLSVSAGRSGWKPDGQDELEFLISSNAGEEPKPLAKIASGGELSRVMLSIKNVLAQKDRVGTAVFDEIDTGVSGKAAQKIGQKLQEVAQNRQVICVTHLAQVAVYADHHLLIEKSEEDGRTYTRIKPLDRQGRVEEIARMISGENLTETAIQNAREMLSLADQNLINNENNPLTIER